MNWAERAKVVAARASTLPEDQIPPAYRPFIKIMASQASQAEEACSKVFVVHIRSIQQRFDYLDVQIPMFA